MHRLKHTSPFSTAHEGVQNLYARIERMRELGPTFIDITWGAGGTRADTTAQFVKAAHEEFGLETCMHLTCTDMARDKIEKALEVCARRLVLQAHTKYDATICRMRTSLAVTTSWL